MNKFWLISFVFLITRVSHSFCEEAVSIRKSYFRYIESFKVVEYLSDISLDSYEAAKEGNFANVYRIEAEKEKAVHYELFKLNNEIYPFHFSWSSPRKVSFSLPEDLVVENITETGNDILVNSRFTVCGEFCEASFFQLFLNFKEKKLSKVLLTGNSLNLNDNLPQKQLNNITMQEMLENELKPTQSLYAYQLVNASTERMDDYADFVHVIKKIFSSFQLKRVSHKFVGGETTLNHHQLMLLNIYLDDLLFHDNTDPIKKISQEIAKLNEYLGNGAGDSVDGVTGATTYQHQEFHYFLKNDYRKLHQNNYNDLDLSRDLKTIADFELQNSLRSIEGFEDSYLFNHYAYSPFFRKTLKSILVVLKDTLKRQDLILK